MGLPASSVAVTPGSGVNMATELVSSKEYEVMMEADAYGHKCGSGAVWVGSENGSIFPTGLQKLCALWNGAGSGVVLEVLGYAVVNFNANNDTASPGAMYVRMHRITSAPSAGSTRTPVALNTSSTALPAQVAFYQHGLTVSTSGDPLSIITVGLRGGGDISSGARRMLADPRGAFWEPIILAEGEGIVIDQGDNNNVAENGGQQLIFRVR
jgi:hypothetical protein